MSGECDRCSELCNEDLTSISTLQEGLLKNVDCRLVHSRIPKKTEKGIVWLCKEGCDENFN